MYKIFLPIVFAIIGYLFTTDKMILLMDSLSPPQGLLFYYSILFLVITILQYFGLVIGDVKMNSVQQTLGEMLILFAFFIIVDFESRYIQWVVDDNRTEKSSNCTGVYLQSEDGATYDIINRWINNPRSSRIITFVVIPFLLTLIGVNMIASKIQLGIF